MHLDWHFRMNNRDSRNAKRAQSRAWYLRQFEWVISNEIEETTDEVVENENENEVEIPSVPAPKGGDPDKPEKCPVCFEEFETFFIDEDEDWHLKNAIRPHGNFFFFKSYFLLSKIFKLFSNF